VSAHHTHKILPQNLYPPSVPQGWPPPSHQTQQYPGPYLPGCQHAPHPSGTLLHITSL
jgi:hypothetical protein